MQKIFLAYANSRYHPLLTLQEEEEQVYRMLARREADHHFTLYRDSYASISKIAEYLARYQEDIVVFHYSGHADNDSLLLDDEAANAAGIAALLSRCPQLRLVVLNGCSTYSQVDRLLQTGLSVVIATSAPVGDRTATQFAISFYQALTERHCSLEEAFDAAVAAAGTQSSEKLQAEKFRAGRPTGKLVEKTGFWGLYYLDRSALSWKLPMANYTLEADYIPNQQLIDRLMQALAPYDSKIKKINNHEGMGIERSLIDKKKAILSSLPHPISQQLRKLMSREMGIEEHIFYDKLGPERLWQIGHTFATIIELLAFILLADLWRGVENSQRKFPAEELSMLKEFLERPADGENPCDYISLIRSIWLIMISNKFPFFVKELTGIGGIFNDETPFADACRSLEILRRRDRLRYTREEAARLCITAENKLSEVFGELGFLAAYSLSSVRNIDVLKYRYPVCAKFNHRVIRLEQDFFELGERPEVLNAYMDASSVLLQHKQGDKYSYLELNFPFLFTSDSEMRREMDTKHGYLNLSPFIIDESAFDKRAELAKLLFFDRYEKVSDMHCYRHIYKPSDAPVYVSSKHNHFRPLLVQFEAFSHSLFHKNLKDL